MNDPANAVTKNIKPLWELMKHVFVGVSVFLLLAIPAIALDIFNQGIELIEIQRSVNSQANNTPQTTTDENSNLSPSQKTSVSPIRVSSPVKLILHIVEYFILGIDVIFVVAYLLNGTWTYLRSLKWA